MNESKRETDTTEAQCQHELGEPYFIGDGKTYAQCQRCGDTQPTAPVPETPRATTSMIGRED